MITEIETSSGQRLYIETDVGMVLIDGTLGAALTRAQARRFAAELVKAADQVEQPGTGILEQPATQ